MNTSFGCTAHKQAVEIVRVVTCKNYSAALGYVAFAYNRGLENSLEAGADWFLQVWQSLFAGVARLNKNIKGVSKRTVTVALTLLFYVLDSLVKVG